MPSIFYQTRSHAEGEGIMKPIDIAERYHQDPQRTIGIQLTGRY